MVKFYIGAHLGKNKTYLNTAKEIHELGGNALSVFIGSPKRLELTKINKEDADATKDYIKENHIFLISHGKYLYNFARPFEPSNKFGTKVCANEIDATVQLGGIGTVIHFGKSLDFPINEASDNMYQNIIEVLKRRTSKGKIILETSSGQGSEMFTKIEEIGKFYKKFSSKDKKEIGFCIDTCHIFAAGYDIRSKEGMVEYLNLWKKHIGLKKILVIHFNDSQTPLGSRRDRHETFGNGYITNSKLGGSFEGIKFLIKIVKKLQIPLIMERGSKVFKRELTLVKGLESVRSGMTRK